MAEDRYKVSETSVMFWDAGQLIWDDYVQQKQLALKPEVDAVIRFFSTWETASEAAVVLQNIHGIDALIELLAGEGVLIRAGSSDALRELDILAEWESWGPPARYLHFSSHSSSQTATRTTAEVGEWFQQMSMFRPRPSISESRGRGDATALPEIDRVLAPATGHLSGLLDSRRSRRSFATEQAFPLSALSYILSSAGQFTRTDPTDTIFGPRVRKRVPSAGALHPLDLFVGVQNVEGLPAGIYAYNAGEHTLSLIREGWTSEEAFKVGVGSEWVRHAHAQIFYVGVAKRTRWKYVTPRAYRSLFTEMGHASQTVYLAAEALGAATTFIGAINDEFIEQSLNIDPVRDLVLGCSCVGARGGPEVDSLVADE